MPGASHTPIRCPICGRPIDPAIHSLQGKLEPHLVRILRARHADWEPARGACPDCVYEAAQQAQAERSVYSLQDELLAPFPVYLPDQAGILPTPARAHAHPKYAGRGVTIAFLDSGFYPHPDLTRPVNRILRYVDATTVEFEEKTSFKRPHITSWHGLMTSSLAAGNGFMSQQHYPGIATQANLVLVKTGSRRSRRITERDIQRALNWVLAHHKRFDIRVVNISLGGDRPSTGPLSALDRKVEEIVAEGLVVVAAAGNGGERRIVPPASAPSAITVGGLDDQNSLDPRFRRMYRSNYGRGAHGASKPDLIAPAIWLAAPMLPGTWVHNEGQFLWRLLQASDAELRRSLEMDYAQARFSKHTLSLPPDEIRQAIRRRMIEQKFIHPHYQHVDGTSMAAPIVSAVVAQMLEADPALTPERVREHLLATAQPLPNIAPERQGHGVIHGGRAVASVLRAMVDGSTASTLSRRRAITLHYYDPDVRQVALVGSFNGWQPTGCEMRRRQPGVWEVSLPAPPRGVYAYKFLVDGAQWIADPENSERIEDGYGGFNSLVTVE